MPGGRYGTGFVSRAENQPGAGCPGHYLAGWAQRVFSHRWLRDNAPENRHPLTGEQCADFAGTEDIPSPRSFAVEYDETLVVAWAGAWEVSRYLLSDLRYGMEIAQSLELALAAD